MHSFAAPSRILASSSNLSSPRRRQLPPSSSSSSRSSSRSTTIKCHHPSQNPKPQKPTSFLHSLSKPLMLASASAATLLIRIAPISTLVPGGGGNNFGGGGGGSSGGDGSSGNFWEKLFSPSPAIVDDNNQTQEWDSLGLPANIVLQLNKLSGFKKYKLSDILFFDRQERTTVGTEDSFLEMVSLRPGGIYTKTQLQKELETLATRGMFEKVEMEGKTLIPRPK